MEALETSRKFTIWKNSLQKSGVILNSMEELSTIRKGNGEVLFSLLRIDAQDNSGTPLLPIVLLRGHFVSVLTCFIEQESGNKFLLLVKQRRVANGEVFYEHPAGMCDSEADPLKVACKEVFEETGFEVRPEQLHAINDEPFYSSPGLLDEGGYFFWCEITLPKKEIEDFKARKTGAAGESEFIETDVVPIEEAFFLMNNTNGMLNLLMYLNARTATFKKKA